MSRLALARSDTDASFIDAFVPAYLPRLRRERLRETLQRRHPFMHPDEPIYGGKHLPLTIVERRSINMC